MSAKAYRDKKSLPLVEKLKEVVKNLTIKCVQLTEQSKKPYDFWVKQSGTPVDRAKRDLENPIGMLKRYSDYFHIY